ncbi:MAG TPA: hypothetical protein VJ476_08235 [Rhizomicrobium sp.]|nr:hypothetical protein [Rhizomicrobium sp.]
MKRFLNLVSIYMPVVFFGTFVAFGVYASFDGARAVVASDWIGEQPRVLTFLVLAVFYASAAAVLAALHMLIFRGPAAGPSRPV